MTWKNKHMHVMSVCMKGHFEYMSTESEFTDFAYYTLFTLEIRIRMASPCKYLGASEL